MYVKSDALAQRITMEQSILQYGQYYYNTIFVLF